MREQLLKAGVKQPDTACHYCNEKAELVSGEAIYPKRKDLFSLNFWLCRNCDAYAGCHKGTSICLGTLAKKETREARKKAHYLFDDLWKLKLISSRKIAYKKLSEYLGITKNECHIGCFDVDTCNKVIVFHDEFIKNL